MRFRIPKLRRRWYAVAGVAVLLLVAGWRMVAGSTASDTAVVTRASKGAFAVVVTTSGELKAKDAVQIQVPQSSQQAGVYQMRIQSLVPEGTVVKAGDVVAELDRSTAAQRANDVRLALQKAQAQFDQAQLDSALTLSTARETIRNDSLAVEEKRLARDQAQYEAPTIRRQAEIDFERAQRALVQAISDYRTRTDQAKAKMSEVSTEVERQRALNQAIMDVMQAFTIRAPSPGMVIYVRDWSGRKRTAGSQVSYWDNSVATLPDLTQMESITYVNEVDVRRIRIDQPVQITLDADPTRHLAGRVVSVANVGEQRPNQDAKVFEVHITVLTPDTTLRPGMTTGNAIETLRLPSVLSVPLEAIYNADSVTFVYHRNGSSVERRQIETGAMNEHAAVVKRGLDEGDEVLLNAPVEGLRLKLARLPTLPPVAAAADSARARAARSTATRAR